MSMSDSDGDDDLIPRPRPNDAHATSLSSSSSISSMISPLTGGGGLVESMNSTLRRELESTRELISKLKDDVKQQANEIADLDDKEDGIVVEEELRLLQQLLEEDLSPDEDGDQPQRMRLDGRGPRAKTAAPTEKSHTSKRHISSAYNSGSNGHSKLRRPIGSAAASSSIAASSAAAASSTSPWDSAVVPPSAASSSSTTPLSPSHSSTLARTQAVLSQYRSKQSTISAYEQDLTKKKKPPSGASKDTDLSEDYEGTVQLKANMDEPCPICLDEMVALDRVASLSCCHTFHMRCILEWFQRSSACPLCKIECFHPLLTVARRKMEHRQGDPNSNQQPISSSSSNSVRSSSSSSRSETPSSDLPARARISSARSAAQLRPSSSDLVDPATRARMRQLRADRREADENARQVRDILSHENSAASSVTRTVSSTSSSPSSASSSTRSSLNSKLTSTVGMSSAALKANVGQLSLSQLLKAQSQPSSLQYGTLTQSSPHGSMGAQSRVSHLASSSSSSVRPSSRPSSNSSSIRAAAAAELSITPTGTKVGKIVTGSTIGNRFTTK